MQLISSIANEKLSRGIRNKGKTETNFPSFLNFTLSYMLFCIVLPSSAEGWGMGVVLSPSHSCCFLLLTLFLCSNMGPFDRYAVLLKQIAPAARKLAPVCAPKCRLQLLTGACSCVTCPWAVASIRTSLPAPEWGFSAACRCVSAPLRLSRG